MSAIKKLAEIWQHCNPGLALLGTIFTLLMMWGIAKITIGLVAVAGALGAVCGPLAGICIGLLTVTVVWSAVSVMAEMLESTVDYMIEGCEGWPA